MKTVEIEVDDKKLDEFLIILKNLKENIVKKFVIKDEIEYVNDKEQQDYENLLKKLSDDDKKIVMSEQVEI
jgi:hypothetical protein